MTQRFSAGSFIVGLMLGLLLAGAWFLGEDFSPLPGLSPVDTTNARNDFVPESGAIAVADQPPGSEVVVESVTVAPPGVWVAVREVIGTALGNVLGAVRVGGPRTNVSITLLRATEPNRPYAVELYRDDGDGTFDTARNSVYIDFDTSAPVIARFKTTDPSRQGGAEAE